MEFLQLALQSSAGAALAIVIYAFIFNWLYNHPAEAKDVLSCSFFCGLVYGMVFSTAHLLMHLAPTLISSATIAGICVGIALLVSIITGNFQGSSIAQVLIPLATLTVLISILAYAFTSLNPEVMSVVSASFLLLLLALHLIGKLF